jgi:hypothetical protein
VSRNSPSIIPKIIGILGFLSIVGIILLFFRPRPSFEARQRRPETPEKLFAQVILSAQPKILSLWEEGDRLIKKEGLNCEQEILFDTKVGRSYYQCQPHFWQCYWQGGVKQDPAIKIDLFGQTFHLRAQANFKSIPAFSSHPRFYQVLKGPIQGLNFHYGVLVEFKIDEIPDLTWPMILTDTCRDVYLPQRIYPYGKNEEKTGEGFIWDNFDRQIFIDKFYVSNQQVNVWKLLNQRKDLEPDQKKWPQPALLNLRDQQAYCSFFGKRLLEAKLLDAASMTPIDQKESKPQRVNRPQTPWQRDLSKTFLGMARINEDYQLTPLDCVLAQVEGCSERFFSTDSVTWMGLNYPLGFYPESLLNTIEPHKNLKVSSRFESPASKWHELGVRGQWEGIQEEKKPVAFRCYEEVSP